MSEQVIAPELALRSGPEGAVTAGRDAAAAAEPFVGLPTQHPAFLATAVRVFSDPCERVTVDGGVPARHPAGPVLVHRGRAPRRLVPPGALDNYEPCDLYWESEAHLERVAGALVASRVPAILPRVPVGSPSIAALKRAAAGRAVMLCRPAKPSPYIALDPGWKDPHSKFNAGRRSDFRRAERHAARHGGLEFEIHHSVEPARLDRLLEEAYAVEARSWKGDQGSALVMRRRLGAFFREFAHEAMAAGILRLAMMRVGGVAVGMQIAVEHHSRFWLFKIGYDAGYGKCAPGNLLMLHTLGYAARRGLRSYEFMGNVAPWTETWTTTLRTYTRVLLYPFSVGGQVALARDGAGFVRNRLARLLPRRAERA